MKTLFRLSLLAFLLFLFTAPLLAQTDPGGGSSNIAAYFFTVPGLAAFITLITQAIKQLKNFSGSSAQYLSWGIALALGVIGYVLEEGMFKGATWYAGLAYTFGAGLIANGLFDWSVVRSLLKVLKLYNGDN